MILQILHFEEFRMQKSEFRMVETDFAGNYFKCLFIANAALRCATCLGLLTWVGAYWRLRSRACELVDIITYFLEKSRKKKRKT